MIEVIEYAGLVTNIHNCVAIYLLMCSATVKLKFYYWEFAQYEFPPELSEPFYAKGENQPIKM